MTSFSPIGPRGGFTLIELSIVLVIIGLIIAGILTGQSLIREAELRSVVTDFGKYKSAIHTFQTKYNCLPGDCAKATTFWGRADGGTDLTQNCASPETDYNAAAPLATCNGDGNGVLGNTHTEDFRLWQHLSNASLIQGTYTGAGGAADASAGWRAMTLGVNAPKSRISGVGYMIQYAMLSQFGQSPFWSGSGANSSSTYMYAGATVVGEPPWAPSMTPGELKSLDSKQDDGRPGTGLLRALYASNGSDPACVTTTVTDTAEYNTDTKNMVCMPLFNVTP